MTLFQCSRFDIGPSQMTYFRFPWLARACVEKVVPRVKLYLRTSRNYSEYRGLFRVLLPDILQLCIFAMCRWVRDETEDIARIIQNGMFHYALINGGKKKTSGCGILRCRTHTCSPGNMIKTGNNHCARNLFEQPKNPKLVARRSWTGVTLILEFIAFHGSDLLT